MINSNISIDKLRSPVRTIKAKVELFEGSTLLDTFAHDGDLISFDVQRVGENKFFGFGICQRLNAHIRDMKRELAITTANNLDVQFGVDAEYVRSYPKFYVSEVHRDEKTNELSVTAYDVLYGATVHLVEELGLESYTIREFAAACAELLGLSLKLVGFDDESVFDTEYPTGANFEGTENIREALNDVAEATLSIYYVNQDNELVFRRLDKDGVPEIFITKDDYIELASKTNRRLTSIVSATELGDNVEGTRRGYVEGNPVSVNDCAAGKPMDITLVSDTITDFSGIEVTARGKNLFNVNGREVRNFGALSNTTQRNFTENSVYLNLALNNYCNAGHKMQYEKVSESAFTLLTPSSSSGGWEAYGAGFNFRVKPDTTYSVSAVFDSTKGRIAGYNFYDEDGNYISNTTKQQNVTTPSNCAWMNVILGVRVRDEAILFENVQLETDSVVTEYEVYKEPQTAVATAEGIVEGLVSYTPTTIIEASHIDAVIKTKYMKPMLTGTTQYVRDNAFWELREDLAEIVDVALETMFGFTIHQFDCEWRGNFLIEIGDKLGFVTKDDDSVYSYLLNDTIEYDGSLKEKTLWEYDDNEGESLDNPSTLGDALKQTYARVDKANKLIEIVASESNENKEAIAQLNIDTDSILASVNSINQTTTDAFNGINEELAKLSKQTSVAVSSDEVEVMIQQKLSNGVSSVETSTGFTFDEEGLTVSKSESDISTTITEDGMKIYNKNKEVLTANNEGVKAIDLHATTYLAIGKYSRFEDYGSKKRTACYWIGG